jgi:competence protein ComEA
MQQYLVKKRLEHDQETYEVGSVADHSVFGDKTAAYLISTDTLKPLQNLADMPSGAVPKTDVFEPPHSELNPIGVASRQSAPDPIGAASRQSAPTPLNLNQADRAALEALPHIGKSTAGKIIAARPYQTLDQAREAAGLSEAKWAELLPQLSL